MGRPKGSKNIPWAAIVQRLRQYPGTWMQLPEMRYVRPELVDVVRRRQRYQLRLPDGTVYARRRATVQLEDGSFRCSILLRFVPKEPKEPVDG